MDKEVLTQVLVVHSFCKFEKTGCHFALIHNSVCVLFTKMWLRIWFRELVSSPRVVAIGLTRVQFQPRLD